MTNKIKVGDIVFSPEELFIEGRLIRYTVTKIVPPGDIVNIKRLGRKKTEPVWIDNLKPYSKKEVNEVKLLIGRVTK